MLVAASHLLVGNCWFSAFLGLDAEKSGGQLSELSDCTHAVLWHQQQPAHAAAVAAGKAVVSPLWAYGCLEARRVLSMGHKVISRGLWWPCLV